VVIFNAILYAFYELIEKNSQLITVQFVKRIQNDVKYDVGDVHATGHNSLFEFLIA